MSTLRLRVMVLDTWDELTLQVLPSTRIADLKRLALERARVRRPADAYQVKYRGAELGEGELTLAEAGVVANAPLIVLPRRRIPAR